MLVAPNVDLIARMLIDQHGSESRGLAAKKAHELSEEGDYRSLIFWNRVIRAIDKALMKMARNSMLH